MNLHRACISNPAYHLPPLSLTTHHRTCRDTIVIGLDRKPDINVFARAEAFADEQKAVDAIFLRRCK
jgi:hypothetical protein